MIPRSVRKFNGASWEREVISGIQPYKQVRYTGSTFNLPDVIVPQVNIGVECKNWGIEHQYLVDGNDIQRQVLPKFKHNDFTHKILAFKRRMPLSAHAWELLRKNKIAVSFGLEQLLQTIKRLLPSCDANHLNSVTHVPFAHLFYVIRFLCLGCLKPRYRKLCSSLCDAPLR